MSKKHVDTAPDLDKGYERNEIAVKGIIYFGVGLLMLIVITFVLIWTFLYKMRDFATQNADPANPIAMSDKDKLPSEPRLQAAPGFGVDSQNGRVSLELMPPASEYIEMRKQWDELLTKGRVDAKTGVVTVMPIEAAKKRLLENKIKAKSGPDAEKVYNDSRKFISDESGGRLASETRR